MGWQFGMRREDIAATAKVVEVQGGAQLTFEIQTHGGRGSGVERDMLGFSDSATAMAHFRERMRQRGIRTDEIVFEHVP